MSPRPDPCPPDPTHVPPTRDPCLPQTDLTCSPQPDLGKPLPPRPELDHKESNLISDLLQLLAMARFNVLTKEEWDLATMESFSYSMPVTIEWWVGH